MGQTELLIANKIRAETSLGLLDVVRDETAKIMTGSTPDFCKIGLALGNIRLNLEAIRDAVE